MASKRKRVDSCSPCGSQSGSGETAKLLKRQGQSLRSVTEESEPDTVARNSQFLAPPGECGEGEEDDDACSQFTITWDSQLPRQVNDDNVEDTEVDDWCFASSPPDTPTLDKKEGSLEDETQMTTDETQLIDTQGKPAINPGDKKDDSQFSSLAHQLALDIAHVGRNVFKPPPPNGQRPRGYVLPPAHRAEVFREGITQGTLRAAAAAAEERASYEVLMRPASRDNWIRNEDSVVWKNPSAARALSEGGSRMAPRTPYAILPCGFIRRQNVVILKSRPGAPTPAKFLYLQHMNKADLPAFLEGKRVVSYVEEDGMKIFECDWEEEEEPPRKTPWPTDSTQRTQSELQAMFTDLQSWEYFARHIMRPNILFTVSVAKPATTGATTVTNYFGSTFPTSLWNGIKFSLNNKRYYYPEYNGFPQFKRQMYKDFDIAMHGAIISHFEIFKRPALAQKDQEQVSWIIPQGRYTTYYLAKGQAYEDEDIRFRKVMKDLIFNHGLGSNEWGMGIGAACRMSLRIHLLQPEMG